MRRRDLLTFLGAAPVAVVAATLPGTAPPANPPLPVDDAMMRLLDHAIDNIIGGLESLYRGRA